MSVLHTPEIFYEEIKSLLSALYPKREFCISIRIDNIEQQNGEFHYSATVFHYVKAVYTYCEEKKIFAIGHGDSAEMAAKSLRESLLRRQTAYQSNINEESL